MKTINILLILIVTLISCEKTSYVAKFEQSPEERVGEQISELKNTLLQAESGWIGLLTTQGGGGYSFYMDFAEDQALQMVADLTDESAGEVTNSFYRVKQDMGVNLVFDTYNYISMLNDPNPNVFGGATRLGYESDIEFVYDRLDTDTLFLIGKRYRQPFELIKATGAQEEAYKNGGFRTAIEKMKQFFVDNANPYFDLGTTRVAVVLNSSNNLAAGKRVDLSGLFEDGSVKSSSAKFGFTLDGASILDSGLVFEGNRFVSVGWEDESTLALYDVSGASYTLSNSLSPILPLYKLWGNKYSGMVSEFQQIHDGTSEAGAAILNQFHNNMLNGYTGFVFNYGRMNFEWNTVNSRLSFKGFSSQNGGQSGWVTETLYNYAVDDAGIYTFTLNTPPSGGYVSTAMTAMHDFLLNNRIEFDYHLVGTTVYAKMSSLDDPGIVMTFELN